MTDYTKNTNFGAKDALITGDPQKKILGSAYDSEFDEIAGAIASKINSSDKGVPNGVAPLDVAGKLAYAYLPSEVAAGPWSPVITQLGGSHGTSTVAFGCRYVRVGSVVFFSGIAQGVADGVGGSCVFRVSLPVGSLFTNTYNVTGAIQNTSAYTPTIEPSVSTWFTVGQESILLSVGMAAGLGYILNFAGSYIVQ